MMIQTLNGRWEYRVGKGAFRDVTVPFSALPVGHSECVRRFHLEQMAPRMLLRFDGITYAARVTLNGVFLGEMLAYAEYTFDVTDHVRERDNELVVELEDISPAFGPTEGWENYGGIIRDVSLIYKSGVYVKDVFFRSKLNNGYRDAEYVAEVTLSGRCDGELRVSLSYDGVAADSYTVPAGSPAVPRRLTGIRLWSPDLPCLYELRVELWADGRAVDECSCLVGFREFTCDRHRFLLNGRPIFLQGVCRHEMMGNSGHVVAYEQIENDMRMIKEAGCNFVRLVHYPHCKATLEIADRIGLMVSEEPGLWWSDTSDPEVSRGSLEVLRRTVIRDRNHASIVFWLCFNECIFTEDFLVQSARVCRESDPTRLVSGANCMSDEETLKYYNICGFDFYTMHPYSPTFERAATSAKMLCDKPLMFTEWGGYFVYDNPHLITEFIEQMYALYENGSDSGALAGACFWYWAEVNDFGRGGPACVDGVLKEALVDGDRRPTMIYKPYFDAWRRVKERVRPESLYYYRGAELKNKRALRCDAAVDRERVRRAADNEVLKRFATMRGRKVSVGPVLGRCELEGMYTVPYLLCDGERLGFECAEGADGITLLGLACIPGGYPISGEYGQEVATVRVSYTDGREESFSLRNGIELTCAYASLGSSRIDPRGERTERFAEFGYDKNFENYVINRLDLPLTGESEISGIELVSANNGYGLLIYGIFI